MKKLSFEEVCKLKPNKYKKYTINVSPTSRSHGNSAREYNGEYWLVTLGTEYGKKHKHNEDYFVSYNGHSILKGCSSIENGDLEVFEELK